MDSNLIKLVFIFLFFFINNINAIEFNGKFIQGHFILGKTDPGSKILIDNYGFK